MLHYGNHKYTLSMNFRLIAVGALLSTVTACGLIMIQALLDHSYLESKMDPSYQNPGPVVAAVVGNMSAENLTTACTNRSEWFKNVNEDLVNDGNDHPACGVRYPTATVSGTFKAFASIMFAFAGASTFPTIQADMKEKQKFNTAAYIACISKLMNFMYKMERTNPIKTDQLFSCIYLIFHMLCWKFYL